MERTDAMVARLRTKEEAFHILAKMVMQQTNEDYVRAFLLTYKKFSSSPIDVVKTWQRQYPSNLSFSLLPFADKFVKAWDKQEADKAAARRSPLPTRLLEFLRIWAEEFTNDFAAQPQTASLLETIKERCTAQVLYKYKLLFFRTISSHQQLQQPPPSPNLSDSPSPSPRSPHAMVTSSPSRSREATPNGTPRERANSRDSAGSRSESETGDGSEDEELGDENLSVDDFTAQQIAVELTSKEQRLFAAIPASEFMEKLGFGPNLPSEAGSQDEDKTPFVSALVEHFNNVSFWVSTEVLMGSTPKEQAKKISKFIAVAVHLYNLNNFNGLMEVIAGLNFSSVKRLAAWAKVSGKDRKVFEKLASRMAIHNNYKGYRQLFQKKSAPKLPYFAVILRDLMFVQVGNLDYLEASGLINFEKILLVYEILSDIKRWQQDCKEYKSIKMSVKHVKKIKQYMRRLHSIQDESILFFLSSLHEGENKKSEGDIGGMGALSTASTPQANPVPLQQPPPLQQSQQQQQLRASDASDPGEETGEEESSLSDISAVVTSIDVDDDYDGDECDCSPSPSPSTSSTSSSFSSLSVIAASEEIDFDAEVQNAGGRDYTPPAPAPSPATGLKVACPVGVNEKSPQAVNVSAGGLERRSHSVENETKARQQLPLRKGATNTEIYGSLRYSRKHAGAVQGHMDGSAIGGAGPQPGPADDSHFMRAVARRRELKKGQFGSVLSLHELVAGGSAGGAGVSAAGAGEGGGEDAFKNQTLQQRMKRLCFAEEKPAGSEGAGPRSIAERVPPLPLYRSDDDRLLQKRRVMVSPRDKRALTVLGESAPSTEKTDDSERGHHRKRGSSWTGKSKDDTDARKMEKEMEKEKEKEEKEKKRMGSLRILSPRRGSNGRAISTTSKSSTMPASPRGSISSLTFAPPSMSPTKDRKTPGRPTTPRGGRAATPSATSTAPEPTATASVDDWGEFEEEGDEEWEFGQWLEKQVLTEQVAGAEEGRQQQQERRAATSVVVKSYWNRGGRVLDDEGSKTRSDEEEEQAASHEDPSAAQVHRQRKLTMPPCRICFTKIDPEVRLHLAPFLLLLSQKHGASHKEDCCSSFVYLNETEHKVAVKDEQAFQEFLQKGGKRYSTVSRQGPCSLLTYTVWLQ